jgi:hypothetical protein
MRNRRTNLTSAVLAVLVIFAAVTASTQQRGRGAGPAAGPPHDAHDLSGIWLGRAVQLTNTAPPSFTPAGKAAFDKNKPSFGPRAIAPVLGNDPLGGANPPGFPRVLINHATKIQFVQLPDKMVQLIEWNRVWREIWTDGRPLPDDPDLAWYGYSTGRWEGDEFVVETVGLDPRAWIDQDGNPKSDAAHVQERYHRVDRDNLELTISVTDPKMYTARFGGDNKLRWRLQPNTPTGNFIEDIFAPMDEESFNRRMRDPAGGKPR